MRRAHPFAGASLCLNVYEARAVVDGILLVVPDL
jgi:hypothetical protein